MNKVELAAYLVNLHSLMGAQEATARNKSKWLIAEYDRVWQQFQDEVTNENRIDNGEETRTGDQGSLTGWGGTARPSPSK